MKNILTVLALVALVGCGGGGGDAPGDGNPNPNPTPIPQAVQDIIDDCAGTDVELLLGLLESLAEAVDPSTTTSPFGVDFVEEAEGLIRVTIDLDNDFQTDLFGLLTILTVGDLEADPPVLPAPPPSIDFSQFAQNLDSLPTAIANSTEDIDVSLSIEPSELGIDGQALATASGGAITGFAAELTLIPQGEGCGVFVSITDAGPDAFSGPFPDLTANVQIDAQINGVPTSISAVIVFDGTSTAIATVTVPGTAPFEVPIDLTP